MAPELEYYKIEGDEKRFTKLNLFGEESRENPTSRDLVVITIDGAPKLQAPTNVRSGASGADRPTRVQAEAERQARAMPLFEIELGDFDIASGSTWSDLAVDIKLGEVIRELKEKRYVAMLLGGIENFNCLFMDAVEDRFVETRRSAEQIYLHSCDTAHKYSLDLGISDLQLLEIDVRTLLIRGEIIGQILSRKAARMLQIKFSATCLRVGRTWSLTAINVSPARDN